jgi:hypothetical protein
MLLTINQKGEVSLTRSSSNNKYLESEIRRVIKGFPKFNSRNTPWPSGQCKIFYFNGDCRQQNGCQK